ncbi:hypothetical protein V7P28_40990, partial [Klebsiella michiganensis]
YSPSYLLQTGIFISHWVICACPEMHHRPAHHPASEFAGRTSFILRKYNEIYFSPHRSSIISP